MSTETLFEGVPRLVRSPQPPYIVPPLTRLQRWRLWLVRRLAGWLSPIPNLSCECDGQHPHKDWPR